MEMEGGMIPYLMLLFGAISLLLTCLTGWLVYLNDYLCICTAMSIFGEVYL